jgi:hypothetical protein
LQQSAPLGDRNPVYHSCDPTGGAVATMIATKTTNERMVQVSKAQAPRLCRGNNPLHPVLSNKSTST